MPAGLILGIISAIQGGRAKKLGYTGGKATAGMVLGSFAIVISVLMMVYIVVAIIANPDFIQEMIETYNEVYEDIEFNR
ncbi:MAG: hypothetical protein FWG14_02445 [Peptococcaceae bacterium]|nr:hypothetical protein [Peptococcaceae bacterium]